MKLSGMAVVPCGPTSGMERLGQSEDMLSAVAIRALCIWAKGGH